MNTDEFGEATRPPFQEFFYVGLPVELYERIDPSSRCNPAMLDAIREEWPRLMQIVDDITELYDDLPITDFVSLWQSVMRLSAYGVSFDDAFLARLDELRASIKGTDEDTDYDEGGDNIDFDVCDDDIGSAPFWWTAGDWKGAATRPLRSFSESINGIQDRARIRREGYAQAKLSRKGADYESHI